MSTELQRSQFAQETLDRSTQELLQLGEQYNDLDYYLKSARTLATTLLKSNKSDTWYLEATLYLLLATIAWLFFRRVIYGPAWWLIYLPLKLTYKIVFAVFAAVGLTGGSTAPSVGLSSSTSLKIQPSATDGLPRFPEGSIKQPHIQVGHGGGQPAQNEEQKDPSPDGSLSQQVGQMTEEAKEQVTLGDGTVLQESNEPRNPKKRMFNPEVENAKYAEQQAKEQAEREKQEKGSAVKDGGVGAKKDERKRDEL
jgi:protein transport protein SEC20